ncbi:hypothetical protein [Chitinophaga caseinilytica]|uniref:Uncharacterized protein n=1 Tax=Chitinophaga caseinilytica TaxID=2267521 RepID=A0ABZ2Z590_9BACT
MNGNKSKQKILIELYNEFKEGERKTQRGYEVTELGRSIKNNELHERTNISLQNVNKYCDSLVHDEFIRLYSHDPDSSTKWYLITEKGIAAISDKHFQKEDNNFLFGRVKDSALVVIALASLVLNYVLFQTNRNTQTIFQYQLKKLEERIDKFEQKVPR